MYAEFQHLSVKCVDPSVDPSDVEKLVRTTHNLLAALKVHAPDDLFNCRTSKGATLVHVFNVLSYFFSKECKCSLILNESAITFHGVLHVMSQLIKQLLKWYLTHDKVFDLSLIHI